MKIKDMLGLDTEDGFMSLEVRPNLKQSFYWVTLYVEGQHK